VTGLIGSVSAWVGAPLAGFALLTFITPMMPRLLPSALLENSSELAAAIVNQMLRPILIQGIVLALLGAGMLGLALIASRLRRAEEQPG
jgi:hypothetical protein